MKKEITIDDLLKWVDERLLETELRTKSSKSKEHMADLTGRIRAFKEVKNLLITKNKKTMKDTTPLQELIEDARNNIKGCVINLQEHGLTEMEKTHYNAAIIVAEATIEKATELLEKEKKIIIDAYTDSIDNERLTSKEIYGIGEDYYDKKFKQ